MPRQPRDARRTEMISLVIRPIGAPLSISVLMHVEPLFSRPPQALLGGEPVEVDAGELPRRFKLPDQVATCFVDHWQRLYEALSANALSSAFQASSAHLTRAGNLATPESARSEPS